MPCKYPLPTLPTLLSAIDRAIPMQQELRRRLLMDLLRDTDADINDIVAAVNHVMSQPFD
jgi:hypothetical protein